MIHKFNEFAEIIGEGFLADRIIMSEDCSKATGYAKDILKGQKIVRTGHIGDNAVKCLKRYNRFLKWVRIAYGSQKFENNTQAEKFLRQKMNELLTCTGDWKKFYQWLRKETLRDASQIIAY